MAFTAKETAARTGQPQDGAHSSEAGLYGYRVRIIDDYSPHAFLPDPCNPQVSGSANALLEDMHTLAYSKRGDLKWGDQVVIQLEQSDFSYNLDYAEIVERVYTNKERFAKKEDCSQPMDFFTKLGTGLPGALPDITYNPAAPDFYDELRASVYFADFSDAFLIGLTANAQAESNFVNAVGESGGDPASQYAAPSAELIARANAGDKKAIDQVEKARAKVSRALPKGDATGNCSHGYWQMNVCSGAGQEFLADLGIDPVTQKAEAIKAFLDKDKQWAFVAKKLKKKFGTGISETNVVKASTEITLKFEKPTNMQQKAKQRAALAEKIFRVAILGAPS